MTADTHAPSKRILDISNDAYKWATSAFDAGEDEMAALVLKAADLLRQAAELYHGTDDQ